MDRVIDTLKLSNYLDWVTSVDMENIGFVGVSLLFTLGLILFAHQIAWLVFLTCLPFFLIRSLVSIDKKLRADQINHKIEYVQRRKCTKNDNKKQENNRQS